MALAPPPSSGELVRGWTNIPLDSQGDQEARQLARDCKGKGLACLVTSDLKRAVETAQFIEDIAKVPIIAKLPELRTWDVGELEGENLKATEPILRRYIMNGKTAPKGGEPFDHFVLRALGKFRQILETSKDNGMLIIGILTHHWVQELAVNCIENDGLKTLYVDRKSLFQGRDDPPTTVFDLDYSGKWRAIKVDPGKINQFRPGPVIIRHASTSMNA